MKRTKIFTIDGYHNNGLEPAIQTAMKVNTANQAKARFLKKYGSMLTGYWRFTTRNTDGMQVDSFVSNKTVTPSNGNKTVTPSVDTSRMSLREIKALRDQMTA